MLRTRPVLFAAPLLLAACATAGSHQPHDFDLPAADALAPAPAVDGRVLVVTSLGEDGLVFEGTGSTGSGPDSVHVLRLPVGVIVREAALKAFGEAFRGGAVPGGERPEGASFTAVVAPKLTRFDWDWKGGPYSSELGINLEVSVSLLDEAGKARWERRYPVTELKSLGLSDPGDLLSWLTHQAALKALRQAARDVTADVAPQAIVPAAVAATAAPGPPPRPPRPVELFLEVGLGMGTTSIPIQLEDGSTYRINTGGLRLMGGVRLLRLADRRLETRASIGLTVGPPLESLKVATRGTHISFDAEVTEDLRLGDWWVGAGWYQRLAVDVWSEDMIKERWTGRPCWVAHLEWTRQTPFTQVAFGFRVSGERLVSDGGRVVNGAVLGLYSSLTGDFAAPASKPSEPATPP